MRRKDREVTDTKKISGIMDNCQCCRLGLNDEGKVYIVPLSFGYTQTDGGYTIYFHGAGEGRKIDLIRKNHYAGFEMDTGCRLKEAKTACEYSVGFQSIIGNGTVDFVEDFEEKKKALIEIMKHNTGRNDWEFSEQMMKAVCVFKLTVQEISCKEHE